MAVVLGYHPLRSDMDRRSGNFTGDAEGLVDKLIACCVLRPSESYTGHGRELVPFDFESFEMNTSYQAQAQVLGKTLTKAVKSMKTQGKRDGPGKTDVASPLRKQALSRAQGTSKVAKALAPQSSGFGCDCTSLSQVLNIKVTEKGSVKTEASTAAESMAAPAGSSAALKLCAGPAFSSSPKPEALPKPTTLLLQRANAALLPKAHFISYSLLNE